MHRALLLLAIALPGCSGQVRNNTLSVGRGIGEIQRFQVFENLSRFVVNADAIPSQFELGGGSTDVSNAYTGGTLPGTGLAFRAIALTGIALSTTNTAKQSWVVQPVTGATDLRLLQMLYRYALGRSDPAADPGAPEAGPRSAFAGFLSRFNELSPQDPDPDRAGNARLGTALNFVIGRLPEPPFIGIGEPCTESATREYIDGRFICFLPATVAAHRAAGPEVAADPLSATAVQSRFIMWINAATQDIFFAPSAPAPVPALRRRPAPPRPAAPPGRPESTAPPAPFLSQRGGFTIQRRPQTLLPPFGSGLTIPTQ